MQINKWVFIILSVLVVVALLVVLKGNFGGHAGLAGKTLSMDVQ